ncbi:hypothetical protein DV737_g3346, partial [Chaetothyriales sp. CBS 132003]
MLTGDSRLCDSARGGQAACDCDCPSLSPATALAARHILSTRTRVRGGSLPSSVTLAFRPRTQSPSRPLVRPQSSGGVPLMQRAHSSPGVDSSGRFIAPSYPTLPRRPASPLQAGRRRGQFGAYAEDLYTSTPSRVGLTMEPNIPEHEELELPEGMIQQASPTPAFASTLAKSRRRGVSVLHQSASAPSLHARAISPGASASHSRSASPSMGASRHANDVYPGSLFGSASSMPSTPTSMRSRSPSISSLETIEDSPDAEEQARLEDEEARQRAADDDGGEARRKSTGEARASALRSNKERKRWSVCGAERRADFSLEVIEEQEEKGAGPAYDLKSPRGHVMAQCGAARLSPACVYKTPDGNRPHGQAQARTAGCPDHDTAAKHGLDDAAFGGNGAVAALRTFDAFPKTKASYTATTTRGGQWTLALIIMSALLAVAELATWWRGTETHHFSVERGVGHELQLNLDIVVAMACDDLHVNVQDAAMDRIMAGELLTKERTNFALPARQREEEQDAHGNKVQGDFHITARGHGYIEFDATQQHLSHNRFNFSHHVNELSFGPHYPGLLNPLDRTTAATREHLHKFQYFVSVVPTIFTKRPVAAPRTGVLDPAAIPQPPTLDLQPDSGRSARDGQVHHHAHPLAGADSQSIFTNQYAATSQSHPAPDQQIPGIFVKYDIEPVLLIVSERRASLLGLLVRLVNVVSGVLVGGGWLFQLAEWASDAGLWGRRGRRRSASSTYLGIGHRRANGSMDVKVGLD